MTIDLLDHQKKAITKLKTGSILWGGVGSGKSITSLAYYYSVECGGIFGNGQDFKPMIKPKDLYIITTAKKRDSVEWEGECANFMISKDRDASINGVLLTVDSWNNIGKYSTIKNAFFIFDEQRVVGSGSWVKSFIKITKLNNWILLTATPGDTWMDYIPVFVANGFYKNRTEFIRKHVVYNTFTKYPKIDRFVETGILLKFKSQVLVEMPHIQASTSHIVDFVVPYDLSIWETVTKKRWNPYTNLPIKESGEAGHIMRKVVNSDLSRLEVIKELLEKHKKLIVFYTYNYELDMLNTLRDELDVPIAEYNGHSHQGIPKAESWIYLVQYMSGAEGWNCIETNTVVFYSLNYSYRLNVQAFGRVVRLNTPFANLYCYRIRSDAPIDLAILQSLKGKKDFNERRFVKNMNF